MSKASPFLKYWLMGLFAILMFFIGITVRSYFAVQKEKKLAEDSAAALWKIEHETEAALLTRISLAWPAGTYIFCRYDLPTGGGRGKSVCIKCPLGGKEPITDFELCSAEMQKQKKKALIEERKKLKKKEKKNAIKKRH